MRAQEIVIIDEPRAGDLEFLNERIYEFNTAATGFHDGRQLAAFIRDERGDIVAGVCGHTWGGCCEVRLLWVHESQRSRGLGRRLLQAVEAEARKRSCLQIVLNTHSFQAPEFYRKHGYSSIGVFEDYPRGHAQIFLQKRLT